MLKLLFMISAAAIGLIWKVTTALTRGIMGSAENAVARRGITAARRGVLGPAMRLRRRMPLTTTTTGTCFAPRNGSWWQRPCRRRPPSVSRELRRGPQ